MEEEIQLNFKLEKGVVIPGRLSGYHMEGFLGEGCYGKVVKCTNLDTQEAVAVKIVRKDCFREGKKEARMLRKLCQLDPEKNNLLKFVENFKYKGHFFLVFEMLDISIYDFIKNQNFVPLGYSEIRVIAQQLLVALNALEQAGLVHADIKPDNIMLVKHKTQPFKVKLIDFGLAVKTSKLWSADNIQAIGYRAPEVILGLPMNEAIDMWSLGCNLAFLYLGYNLYPTYCEYEVVRAMVHLHGQPRDDMLKNGIDVKHFFTELPGTSGCTYRLNTPAEYTDATGYRTQVGGGFYRRLHSLDDLLKTRRCPTNPTEEEDAVGFLSLIKGMLLVDPDVRITPRQALGHRFITMRHLSGARRSSYVAAACKMVTDSQLQKFEVERYVTSSEAAKKKIIYGKKIERREDSTERLADKGKRGGCLIKVRSCVTAPQEGAVAADEIKYESSGKTHNNTSGRTISRKKDASKTEAKNCINEIPSFAEEEHKPRTFVKVNPCSAVNQQSAAIGDKTPGKGKYTLFSKLIASRKRDASKNKTTSCNSSDPIVGHTSGKKSHRKGPASKASGDVLVDINWEERTVIKVKPYSGNDEEGKARADKEDALSGKAWFSPTNAGTSKKGPAAEKDVKPYSGSEKQGKARADKKNALLGKAWFSPTNAGTSKKGSAAEKEAISCKDKTASGFVEVKSRKTSLKRAWNAFSRLVTSFLCNGGC